MKTHEELEGLTSEAADLKLKEFGPNEIQLEKPERPWVLFANQFKSPLVVILIFACIIALLLDEQFEASAIGGILIVNAFIGFLQEFRAETAIVALRKMTSPRAKVLRDGRPVSIMAQAVVPGDILLLEAGDVVAADAMVIQAVRFQVNEATLTGESIPATKHSESQSPDNDVFMGTSVVTGTAKTRVIRTGMKTELGKIAHLITTAQSEESPLQKQLAQVGKLLLAICLVVIAVIFIIGWARGLDLLELLIFSISLAVAVVPEGMPAIITVSLALGVQRMAKKNALVRKLPSVETLASVTVICTDKTGTLTTGIMQIREVWGADPLEVLRVAASCCDAELGSSKIGQIGDPTEVAILRAAREKGIDSVTIDKVNPRVSSEPFDSDRRRMSVFRRDGINYIKGAPESLVVISRQDEFTKNKILSVASEMSSRGLRVLAVGRSDSKEEKQIEILGLLGASDPPRPEAASAIREAREAGILSVMITGDHPQTAVAIAKELGLILEGESSESRVHARASPEDKLRLVRSWKERGAVVAMTGDGVNDAPALREAHVGIAMGLNGTEVTRQAADLILADDNFATIVTAVREGRGIFANIRKAITYLLAGNFAEIALVFCAVSLGLPPPLLAVHLLWINLVTDALPALALVADPIPSNIMQSAPRATNEKILERKQWYYIGIVGLIEGFVSLAVFWHLIKTTGDENLARSVMFSTLVFSQLFRSLSSRSQTELFWEVGIHTNKWLMAVLLCTGLLQLSLYYIPWTQTTLGLKPLTDDLVLILSCSLIPFLLIELNKLLRRAWY